MKLLIIFLFFLSCAAFAQEVTDFSISPCDKNAHPQFTRNRVISKEFNEDALTLRLGMVFNCCATFNPTVSLSSDSLFLAFLDDSNDSIVEYCGCNCCYNINLEITGVPDSNFRLFHTYSVYDLDSNSFKDWVEFEELRQLENKYIFPAYYELEECLRFEGETNLLTSDGQRIGLWKFHDDDAVDDSFKMAFYRIDQNGKSKADWSAHFDSVAKLISISVRTGPNDATYVEGRTYYEMFAPGVNFIKD